MLIYSLCITTTGKERGKEGRRKGLENFLRKVARHPVLGCTRFLKVFLTEDTKSDKVCLTTK